MLPKIEVTLKGLLIKINNFKSQVYEEKREGKILKFLPSMKFNSRILLDWITRESVDITQT